MKDTRINIRIPTAEKEAWETVADRYGLSLTEFVTRSVRGTMLNLSQSHNQNSASQSLGAATTVAFAHWPEAREA